ncbi:YbhB/YbcL family Raf kinase inhibitor-like protein [Rhizobiaceae bacterium]|nr:YbhB/YbcL family Raf kinase inhibitor-like protein [Rhizobiaceae bacterium]
MKRPLLAALCAILFGLGASTAARAQDKFQLTSPVMTDGGTLPENLKCERHGGKGVSPPVAWSAVPEGTKGLALMMFHYPKGTVEGIDPPSHYWLLWNIPLDTTSIPEGNPASLGDEGSDKDNRRTGYTPPCSPSPWWSFFSTAPKHTYVIEVFALNEPLTELPAQDDQGVDWTTMTKAMDGKIIASSKLSFMD